MTPGPSLSVQRQPAAPWKEQQAATAHDAARVNDAGRRNGLASVNGAASINGVASADVGERVQAPAADRVLRILRYLSTRARPVPAASISRALNLPRSTTYQLLAVLERHGFVAYYPGERRYGLGDAAVEIGSTQPRLEGIERLAQPLLADVASEAGVIAHLAVLEGHEAVYVATEGSWPRGEAVLTPGLRLPVHASAAGRALLAPLRPGQVQVALPPGEALPPPHTLVADRAGLASVLEADRDRGWSLEDGELAPNLAAVAAPVTDHAGRPVVALGASFNRERDAIPWSPIASIVRRAAQELTARLGGDLQR